MPNNPRVRASVAVLAIFLFSITTIVAASHLEASHRECPICHIAHLPVIKPVEAAHLGPLHVVARHAILSESIQEQQPVGTSASPRAPPF